MMVLLERDGQDEDEHQGAQGGEDEVGHLMSRDRVRASQTRQPMAAMVFMGYSLGYRGRSWVLTCVTHQPSVAAVARA